MDDRWLDAPVPPHPAAGEHHDAALLQARQLRLFDGEAGPAFARWDRAVREASLCYPTASELGLRRASGLLQCVALAQVERRVQRVCDLLDAGLVQAEAGELCRLDQFALHVSAALWPACPQPTRSRLRRHLRGFALWSELRGARSSARACWANALVDLVEVACQIPEGLCALAAAAQLREAAARPIARALSGAAPDPAESQPLLSAARALLEQHPPALPLVHAVRALVAARLLLAGHAPRALVQSR